MTDYIPSTSSSNQFRNVAPVNTKSIGTTRINSEKIKKAAIITAIVLSAVIGIALTAAGAVTTMAPLLGPGLVLLTLFAIGSVIYATKNIKAKIASAKAKRAAAPKTAKKPLLQPKTSKPKAKAKPNITILGSQPAASPAPSSPVSSSLSVGSVSVFESPTPPRPLKKATTSNTIRTSTPLSTYLTRDSSSPRSPSPHIGHLSLEAPLAQTSASQTLRQRTLCHNLATSWAVENITASSISLLNQKSDLLFSIVKVPSHTPVVDAEDMRNSQEPLAMVIDSKANALTADSPPSPFAIALLKEVPSQRLQEGESQSTLITNRDNLQKSSPSLSIVPSVLIQTNPPSISSSTQQMASGLQKLKTVYKNILQEAASLGCTHVQLPLLSAKVSVGTPFAPLTHQEWIDGNHLALLEAVAEIPKNNTLKHIFLVGSGTIPSLSGTALNYAPRIKNP